MAKPLNPKKFSPGGRSYPTSGEPDEAPQTQKIMRGGYGQIVSGTMRKRESAVVKQSRATLIARLGVGSRKSKPTY
jgi:hypothetical protein